MNGLPPPSDPDGELNDLRMRAYGRDHDIEADPAALARLAELENARVADTVARSGVELLSPAANVWGTAAPASDASGTAEPASGASGRRACRLRCRSPGADGGSDGSRAHRELAWWLLAVAVATRHRDTVAPHLASRGVERDGRHRHVRRDLARRTDP